MDAGEIRIILATIIGNKTDQIEPGETAQALTWLSQRIRLERNDKGGGTIYNHNINAAHTAMRKAVSLFQNGDAVAAKPLAEEALRHLKGCF